MPRPTNRIRRVGALLVGLGLLAPLTACDSGGSASSTDPTSTTTQRRARKPRASTSSTSPGATSTTSAAITTTVPNGQAGPDGTNPPATASCGVQADRFSAVVYGGDLAVVPVDRYTISDCRLSPTRPIWGAVTLAPKPGETVPPLTVVFERVGSIWTLHSFGEGATGCDAPAPAPSELDLGC
jgi:hypothetical protein